MFARSAMFLIILIASIVYGADFNRFTGWNLSIPAMQSERCLVADNADEASFVDCSSIGFNFGNGQTAFAQDFSRFSGWNLPIESMTAGECLLADNSDEASFQSCSSGFTGGSPLVAHGVHSGTGIDNTPINIGFRPDFVMMVRDNSSSLCAFYRTLTNAADTSCPVESNCGATGCVTDRISDFTSSGFLVGTNSSVNAGTVYWFAFQIRDGYGTIGNYTGNGGELDVATAGFQPEAVWANPRGTGIAAGWYFKVAGLADPESASWQRGVVEAFKDDYITDLVVGGNPPAPTLSGFVVDDGSSGLGQPSISGRTYDYIALNEVAGAQWIDQGTYTGDGTASQNITTSCNSVAAVFLRADNQTNTCVVWRTASMTEAVVGAANWAASSSAPDALGGLADLDGNTGTFTAVESGGAGQWECNENAVTYEWLAFCETDSTGSQAAEDWTDDSDLIAYWRLDESSGTRANASSASCGTDCDLTDNNTVGNSSSNVWGEEFDRSAEFIAANSEYLSCATGTCGNELNEVTGDLTWGCALRPTADGNYVPIAQSLSEYDIQRNASNDRAWCVVANGATVTIGQSNNGALPINTWAHIVCAHNQVSPNEVTVFVDTEDQGSTSVSVTRGTDNNNVFAIGRQPTGTSYWQGQIQACFVYNALMTDEDICRVCSCGWEGQACSCRTDDPTKYADIGRQYPECGGCTLPDCNKTGPS